MPSFTSVISQRTPCTGLFISMFSDLAVALIGNSGFDCVITDTEHTPVSAHEATHVVHAVAAASNGNLEQTASLCPWSTPRRMHDKSCKGARYPPLGQRSIGLIHAPFAGHNVEKTQGYCIESKALDVAVVVMLESAEGVKSAKAILACEGVSGAFVGLFDLRLSLGLSGGDGDEPSLLGCLRQIVEADKATEKPVGILASSTASLQKRLSLGFDYIINATDAGLLAQAAETSLQEARRTATKKGAIDSSDASTTVAD
ncbi:uncharacterized protein PV07_08234 [Cladophialophora immunda]|uniref:HpcH/HpaI aldolase/citrate lyase domain-containing protein n=1 Tax=Cladophialophora immunda TaxID=569365 RepID=A0A0D1ZKS7_9EURO|nr:uncharacterized protein PV07_08234 [Cladophialophora immunda]KIW28581.1 hypothetical protein PV07_08234 [Cladophialophora immunda]